MRHIIVFAIIYAFSILPGRVCAQTNFVGGYYVNAAGDTVRGLIENRSALRNRLSCSFKSGPDAPTVRLSPDQISGYVLDDKVFYESWPMAGEGPQGIRGFYVVELKGELSLLSYGKRLFAHKKGDNVLTDISKETRTSASGQTMNSYRGLGSLKVMMEDCPDIQFEELEKAYKSNASLVPAFVRYNTCKGASHVTPKAIKIKSAFNVGLQVSYVSMDMTLKKNLRDLGLHSSGVAYGVSLSTFIPRLNERLRIVVEGTLFKVDEHEVAFSNGSEHDLSLSFSMVRLPLFVRYEGRRFFIDAGMQNHVVLDQKSSWSQTTQLSGGGSITDTNHFDQLSGWSPGFVVGAGIKQKAGNHMLRGGVRYSAVTDGKHFHEPSFSTVEFCLSLQFGRRLN